MDAIVKLLFGARGYAYARFTSLEITLEQQDIVAGTRSGDGQCSGEHDGCKTNGGEFQRVKEWGVLDVLLILFGIGFAPRILVG